MHDDDRRYSRLASMYIFLWFIFSYRGRLIQRTVRCCLNEVEKGGLRKGCRLLLRLQSAQSEGCGVQLRATRPLIGQLGQRRGGSKRMSPPRKSGDGESVQSGREDDVCLVLCYNPDGARWAKNPPQFELPSFPALCILTALRNYTVVQWPGYVKSRVLAH